MANELSGADLDARFFEVCCNTRREDDGRLWVFLDAWWSTKIPPVSTDANACESWAMRWAREAGLIWEIQQQRSDGSFHATMRQESAGSWWPIVSKRGTDWKEAFVRACEAAGQILNKAKGGV